MIGYNIPYLFDTKIETNTCMMRIRIFVSYKLIPGARIYLMRKIFQIPIHLDKSYAIFEWDKRLLLSLPFKLIVDIDTDLEKFQSLQILQNEFPLRRKLFFIYHYDVFFVIKRAMQDKRCRDFVDIFIAKIRIFDRQRAIFFDQHMKDILMSDDISHIIIIMFRNEQFYDHFGRFIRIRKMSMKSFCILIMQNNSFFLIRWSST